VVAPGSVKVLVGSIEHQALSVFAATEPGVYFVVFALGSNVPSGPQVPVTVSLDQRVSLPFYLPIQP
jgi:hypothetical protein